MKLLFLLPVILLVVFSIYWLAIKPEQISRECNTYAMLQMDSKLTYFRANNEGLNDKFTVAYEQCLMDHNYEQYTTSAVGERVVKILMQIRSDSGWFN